MEKMKKNKYSRKVKMIAVMLMNVLACELIFPNVAMALTTGPSQPEVQGFEPVGTTDMVDMFSGSFVYNIPLLDVEGYPVNISYHGGVTMEQEASWVGLGWNINPGVINRSVRGVPDDFNGDSLRKDFHIKPEKTLRVGVAVGFELAGIGDPLLKTGIDLGANVNISNYRGVSCDFSYGGNVNVFHCVSAGVNLGIGSQTGASIDYNASLSLSSSQIIGKSTAGDATLNAGIGGGYSTRTGLTDMSFSISGSTIEGTSYPSRHVNAFNSGATIPISLKNFVPVITNSSIMSTINGRIKLGADAFALYGYPTIKGMFTQLTYNNDASRRAYGYMYLQNASAANTDILDFTRDKDGMFNKTMQFLPVPNMTYDIYSLSGQGTGGTFRPFRNDFGNVYDPYTTSSSTSKSGGAEYGGGNIFEAGFDFTNSNTEITSGPWQSYQRSGTASKGFTGTTNGSIYEPVYFKQGGELTAVDSTYFQLIGKQSLITPYTVMGFPQIKPGAATQRDPRANLIYYHTAQTYRFHGGATGISSSGVDSIVNPDIANYIDPTFTSYGNPSTQAIPRIGNGPFQRKKDQISEIVQVQKDGRKYIYGIPALNNVQREVTFSIDPASPSNTLNLASGIVSFNGPDASRANSKGKDNYYSSTVTPAFAHSYLLTSVLSTDYTDVTGNGVSDDDLGSFTKFDYTRTDSDFRWIAPYSSGVNLAQYSPGFWSDRSDDKASFVCGSREQWNLHAIETKNYIAEFYTSVREDGQGIGAAILNHGEGDLFSHDKATGRSFSYKLDSIKLYNKHDRFVNRENAIPVKSVFFVYDYSLCRGIPNSSHGNGKLTLRKIFFSYGTSQKSMLSPYDFKYDFNPDYDLSAKDRWGNYKPNNPAFTNYEYPYVDQNDAGNNSYAAAWSLSRISLPSGGVITSRYESNDYAYVQDKPVNEMFMVRGLGNSPNYMPGSQLYVNKGSPYLYVYFNRRPDNELASLSFAQNYLGREFVPNGNNCMYFNFNVQLVNSNTSYEQIKGYVNVQDIGICANDPAYGYVRLKATSPTGGGGSLNPVSYVALNTARYNLPQIVFPGQDPNESDMKSILSGLKGSFNELLNIGKSPVLAFIERSAGKNVNLTKSYIRLQSVGLVKKGGGQRVNSLIFSDNWQELAGATEQSGTYGKQYLYINTDNFTGETISSGVASYEPMTGGDENPFRQPVKYIAQSGSSILPNDAVDLYQETPIGESLFPAAQVGYSSVTVASLHFREGRSSKNFDRYDFYTAKDFPVQVSATAINSNSTNHYDFFSQKNLMTATQGYTLVFNDMHGKPKKVEHGIYNLATSSFQPINYQIYHYKENGNKLDNNVRCLVKTGAGMSIRTQQLGIEEDVTLDSRKKNETTTNNTFNANLNFFIIPFFIPIPVVIAYGFPWCNKSENEFQSAVVTKVVQQYGILDNIESYNEGAKTTVHNEVYDPITGQPLITSINNEFQDKEYTTTIPAYWAYNGMSGAYSNIGFKDKGTISVNGNHIGTLHISNTAPLTAGDELSIFYTDVSAVTHHTNAFVMGILPVYSGSGSATCLGINVLPRFPISTPGWTAGTTLTNVSIEVVNSGHKNMLTENVETYSSATNPINSSGVLAEALTGLIDLKAKTFCDSNTRIIRQHILDHDDINPYAIGERGQWRLLSEYAYQTKRNYAGTTARNSGLFSAQSLFTTSLSLVTPCTTSPYNLLWPHYTDSNWHAMRTITKWSPWGKEVENVDAVGNYSTAVFGYNQEQAIAVAANARQGEILTAGFEDFNLLRAKSDIMDYGYMNFVSSGLDSLPVPSPIYQMSMCPPYIARNVGHTGMQSYFTSTQYTIIEVPLNLNYYAGIVNNYNNYFSNSPVSGYHFTSANEYLKFGIIKNKKYILNYWIKQSNAAPNIVDYQFPGCGVNVGIPGSEILYPLTRKSNIIDGWQQVQAEFSIPDAGQKVVIVLPANFYVDDMRIFPADANMKAFVYGPVNAGLRAANGKLMATLDENNYATIYEYDQEGNLVRVKKETTKGIMTVSESRSGNPRK